jgi:predicted AAA+ superfamily ATPase
MVPRTLMPRLRSLARKHPVVTVTGPRQSGKTTLCRAAFPRKAYVSLEAPDVREYAHDDPRGFLAQYRRGAILDEVQRAPELLSYLQVDVDARPDPGRFILTGSQNFGLGSAVAQSLAGRTAMLTLLPLDHAEVLEFPTHPVDLFTTLWTGGYPAILDRHISPDEWLASYTATFVERDVRQILNVGDLLGYQTFVRLCASRSGQLLNLSALGADAGVSHNTARSWLSILEASYLAFRLAPLHANVTSRLVKTPKLHFFDSGLLCWLLDIRSPEQLRLHPLRGPIFESWVVSEILKAHHHRGRVPRVAFYRDSKALEADLVVEVGGTRRCVVEAKSGQTIASDFFASLDDVAAKLGDAERVLVYGGDAAQKREGRRVVPWSELGEVRWAGRG